MSFSVTNKGKTEYNSISNTLKGNNSWDLQNGNLLQSSSSKMMTGSQKSTSTSNNQELPNYEDNISDGIYDLTPQEAQEKMQSNTISWHTAVEYGEYAGEIRKQLVAENEVLAKIAYGPSAYKKDGVWYYNDESGSHSAYSFQDAAKTQMTLNSAKMLLADDSADSEYRKKLEAENQMIAEIAYGPGSYMGENGCWYTSDGSVIYEGGLKTISHNITCFKAVINKPKFQEYLSQINIGDLIELLSNNIDAINYQIVQNRLNELIDKDNINSLLENEEISKKLKELVQANYPFINLDDELFSKNSVIIKYEEDGVPNTSTIESVDGLSYFKALVMSGLAFKTGITNLSLEPMVDNSLTLTKDDGLNYGLNEVHLLVDGKEEVVFIDIKASSDLSYDLSKTYDKDTLAKIKFISSNSVISNMKLSSNSLYQVTYEKDGKMVSEFIAMVGDKSEYLNNKLSKYNIKSNYILKKIDWTSEEWKEHCNNLLNNNSFSRIGNYGGNQMEVVDKVVNYLTATDKSLPIYKEGEAIVNVIKRYYPQATETEIKNIAQIITNSSCAEVAITNTFFDYMTKVENGEQIFEDKFGFCMKNSEGEFNIEILSSDMYLYYINHVEQFNLVESYRNDSSDISHGTYSDKMNSLIRGYFSSKGVDISFNSKCPGDSKISYDKLFDSFQENDNYYFIIGDGFDDSTYYLSDNSGTYSQNGGHAMLLTGIDENALTISTWGEKYTYKASSSLMMLASYNFELRGRSNQ